MLCLVWVRFMKRARTKKRLMLNLTNDKGDGLEQIKDNLQLVSFSSKTISQPIGMTNNHPFYIGKFNSQMPNSPCSGSSTDDEERIGEEIDSSLNLLNHHAKLDGSSTDDEERIEEEIDSSLNPLNHHAKLDNERG